MEEIITFSCPSCKDEFSDIGFHEKFAADSCTCRNLSITYDKEKALMVDYKEEKPFIKIINKNP